jgi:hypothetical protein
MDLVDRNRHPARIGGGPERAVGFVAPDVGWYVERERGGVRAQLGRESERIGLVGLDRAVRADDPVLVGASPAMPGRKISQMPVSVRRRMVWRVPSQSLKSPTTLTSRALGAQTAKWTPRAPSWSITWAPSLSNRR